MGDRYANNRSAVRSIAWLDLWPCIILDLRKEIFADDPAKRDVRNRHGDDEPDNLQNPGHLRKRHTARAQKRSDKATNDEAENPAAHRSNEKKQQPSFEVIEFLWFFHGCDVYGSNENKMNDGW